MEYIKIKVADLCSIICTPVSVFTFCRLAEFVKLHPDCG